MGSASSALSAGGGSVTMPIGGKDAGRTTLGNKNVGGTSAAATSDGPYPKPGKTRKNPYESSKESDGPTIHSETYRARA